MQAKKSTAGLALAATTAALCASAAAQPPNPALAAADTAGPRIEQMVVFRHGKVVESTPHARRATVTLGRRSCAVAAATPMAALIRSRPGKLGFYDYGSCSRHPVDAAGLFVKAIRGQANHGLNGWVYKVGHKLGTAGAADPAGPFGSGRLRSGNQIVWFYCVFHEDSCQRSLGLVPTTAGHQVTVTVTGFDDSGDGVAASGARVEVLTKSGRRLPSATTDGDGKATLTLARGSYALHAVKRGLIRSFAKPVKIDR